MALKVRVCRLDEVVSGELRAFAIAGVTWPVIVTLIDGLLVAVPGVCPHEDVALQDYGELHGSTLVCRVHGYGFDIHSGKCEHDPRLHLRRYHVTVAAGDVWVDLM